MPSESGDGKFFGLFSGLVNQHNPACYTGKWSALPLSVRGRQEKKRQTAWLVLWFRGGGVVCSGDYSVLAHTHTHTHTHTRNKRLIPHTLLDIVCMHFFVVTGSRSSYEACAPASSQRYMYHLVLICSHSYINLQRTAPYNHSFSLSVAFLLILSGAHGPAAHQGERWHEKH